MDLKRSYLLTVFLLVSVPLLNSQNINVAGAFPAIDHAGDLTDRLDYSLYFFAAFPLVNLNKPEPDGYFHLFYSEQAVSYKPNDHLSFTGSYVYQRSDVVFDHYVNENRFYVQAKYKHTTGKISLVHRARFDGRYIGDRLSGKAPFTHRARYLIGLDAPIGSNLYFTAYEEAFFNTFRNPGAVYGENWAYTALGRRLNEKNKIELGALYITWSIGNKNWFNQYYLQATWISRIDLRKTKR